MPRKPAIIPSESIHLHLDAQIKTRMDLFLYSSLEGRVPKGAYKTFIENLIQEFFSRKVEMPKSLVGEPK